MKHNLPFQEHLTVIKEFIFMFLEVIVDNPNLPSLLVVGSHGWIQYCHLFSISSSSSKTATIVATAERFSGEADISLIALMCTITHYKESRKQISQSQNVMMS